MVNTMQEYSAIEKPRPYNIPLLLQSFIKAPSITLAKKIHLVARGSIDH